MRDLLRRHDEALIVLGAVALGAALALWAGTQERPGPVPPSPDPGWELQATSRPVSDKYFDVTGSEGVVFYTVAEELEDDDDSPGDPVGK